MTKDIRWGILPTGWIAELFVKDLLLTGHHVSAVGSHSQSSAARFATAFGIAKAHGSYEALAADADVDIIYIATPHPQHFAAAIVTTPFRPEPDAVSFRTCQSVPLELSRM